MTYIGIDLETDDPHLTDKGVSWVYGEGHIICTSLYFEKTKKKECFKGVPDKVKAMMLEPSVVLVGANIIYDLGWLEHHFGIQGQTKATLCDVIIAEGLIDEYGRHNLEYLGQKYLKRGKVKSGLESWAEENGKKGDFRKHLKDAPWDLVKEYALDDAELPVLIYRKQEVLLAEQNLSAPFELDCKLLKVVLKMKQRGVRIDVKKKDENKRILEDIFREKEKKFTTEYGKVNFNSPKQVAQLMDRCDVNYNVKVTIKGKNNRPFGWADLRSAKQEIDDVVKGFRRKKDKLVAFIEKKYKARMCEILDKAGYQYTANPTVGKKFLALVADEYPVTKMIQYIKQVGGILSKFLGEGFDRFIVNGRVHCDFNVANTDEYGTISGRLSSSNPNLQQIPSKGVVIHKGKEYILAQMCRELFIPEKDSWMLKIDYSQIEYRLLVHYACGRGAEEARQRFNEDPSTDYHQFVMDLTGLERKFAKNCFAVGSFVYTSEGAVRLGLEKDVVSVDGEVQGMRVEVQKGVEGLQFELSNGTFFSVTNEHPFLSFDKVKPVFKEARYFAVGDQLGVRAMRHFGKVKTFRLGSYLRHGYKGDVVFDTTLAYIAGLYTGDGSLGNSGQGDVGNISLCVKDANEKLVVDYFSLLGIKVSESSHFDGGKVIHFASKAFAHFFEDCFGRGTRNKRVPDFIFSSPEDVILSFLAGCFDTDSRIDSCSCSYVGVNEHLVRDVAKLLSFVGCSVKFGKESYNTVIKGKRYTGNLYKANVMSFSKDIPLLVKKENLLERGFSDRTTSWKLDKQELGQLKHKAVYYYKKGQTNGLSRKVVSDIGLEHSKYIPVSIVSITKVNFDAYVMETEDHTYLGEGIPSHNCNFGIMYGMGPGGMQEEFGWSKEHVEEILADYHEALPYVSAIMQKVSEVSAKRGFITTIGGRKARLRNKDMTYTMLNRLNQGGSADIMKAAMVEADEHGVFDVLSAHITVHDELVCSVPKTKQGIEAVQELRLIMENIIKLRVPIIAEPELGDNWYAVKDMDEVVKENVCTKPKAKQNSKKAS